jgi:IS30 family transposase
VRICAETIYRLIDGKEEYGLGLYRYLPEARRTRGSRKPRNSVFPVPLSSFARQSFTFDRGTEFSGFRALEDRIGARNWCYDPSAP